MGVKFYKNKKMDDESRFDELVTEIQNGMMETGVILSILSDILVENDLISREELDKRVKTTFARLQIDIDKLKKRIEDELDNMDISPSPGMMFGPGGDA